MRETEKEAGFCVVDVQIYREKERQRNVQIAAFPASLSDTHSLTDTQTKKHVPVYMIDVDVYI